MTITPSASAEYSSSSIAGPQLGFGGAGKLR